MNKTKENIIEKHYRVIESMLNEFKNKKLCYSDFIDEVFKLEEEYADWKIKECLPEIDIVSCDDGYYTGKLEDTWYKHLEINGVNKYRQQILSNKDKK